MARAHKGWSQTELAKRAGVHHVMISKSERGVTKEIQGSTLRKLCETMGISPQYFLGMTETLESETKPTETAQDAA